MNRITRLALWSLIVASAGQPAGAWACATCFGQSDSSLARGATAGILFLLAVILAMLGGIGVFFVAMARRAKGPDAVGIERAMSNPSTQS